MKEDFNVLRFDINQLLYILSDDKIAELFYFSDKEKKIIEMRWRKRMSFQRIGKELSLTPETVRINYNRLFRRLKTRIRIFIDNYKSYESLVCANADLEKQNDILQTRIRELEFKFCPKPNVDSLKISISDTDISRKAFNALMWAGVKTIGDIMEHSEKDLAKIRNLGSKSMKEIKRVLKSYDLELL